MKSFRFILLFCFCIVTLSDAKYNVDKDFLVAVSINGFDKVQQNKIKSAVIKIESEFKKVLDYKYDVKVFFTDNNEKMLEDYLKYEKYNCVIAYTSFYLRKYNILKEYSRDFFAFTNKDKFHSYVLVVNKDSNINSIKDLKNKSFSSYSGNGNYSNWLDYVTLKELGKGYKSIIDKDISVSKDSRLLLNVFFKKADFTVVKKSVYEDMLLLNPAMKKNIKILKESPEMFIFGFGFFHKNTPDKMIKVFYENLKKGAFEKKLELIYKILNQSSIQKIKEQELKKLENFYKEYENLKRKYNDNN